MSNAPYSSVVSPLNPTFIDWPLSSFLTSSGTAPTATVGYARYTVIGNFVNLEFKYQVATLGTGNYRLNLPIPMVATIGGTNQKPQGLFFVRYSGGAGAQHYGVYGENTASLLNMLAPTTFHGTPANFTSASPDTLVVGDFVHGEIRYEIA
jgi:hypothetical protein